jgi:hypothetical protein
MSKMIIGNLTMELFRCPSTGNYTETRDKKLNGMSPRFFAHKALCRFTHSPLIERSSEDGEQSSRDV